MVCLYYISDKHNIETLLIKLTMMRNYYLMAFTFICLFLSLSLTAQEKGVASYYSDSFQGRKTASGEKYDKHLLTGAHKTLPFGTIVKVTRIDNGKSVKVRINDLGPYISGRIIDLSGKAGEVLGLLDDGTAEVELTVLGKSSESPTLDSGAGVSTKSTPTTLPPAPELKKTAPKKSSSPKTSSTPSPTDNKLVEKGPAVEKEKPKSYEKPVEVEVPKVAREAVKKETKTSTKSSSSASKKRVRKESRLELETAASFKPGQTYRFDISTPKEQLFGVQVAAVKDINSMMQLVTKYQGMWFDDIFVNVGTIDGQPIYKIILGAFPDRKKASNYKRSMKKRKKIDGFVVEL